MLADLEWELLGVLGIRGKPVLGENVYSFWCDPCCSSCQKALLSYWYDFETGLYQIHKIT